MGAYDETLRFLYGLQTRGIKFGLRNTRQLLKTAGHPERAFPSVHLAGTNGKGSTASFLASIAMECGYRTGLYTSPHLVRFTERIRIDGREIPEDLLVEYAVRLRPAIERVRATFFEATTVIAFMYFADARVDIAVIETGLGGRLDATNTLRPLLSVITNISYDHMEYLGSTLRAIAREKAGIFKRGVPAVTSAEAPEALRTLKSVAARKGVLLFMARRLVRVHAADAARNVSSAVGFCSRGISSFRVRPGLGGPHQVENARLAVAAVELLQRRSGTTGLFAGITPDQVARGLRRVRANTGLRGRLERLRHAHCLLDVAHNPAGICALVSSFPETLRGRFVAVFGVMKDKDYRSMLEQIARIARVVVTVVPNTPRALSLGRLSREALRTGIGVVRGGSVRSGVKKALRIARRGETVLITGSHYVAGEALAALDMHGA